MRLGTASRLDLRRFDDHALLVAGCQPHNVVEQFWSLIHQVPRHDDGVTVGESDVADDPGQLGMDGLDNVSWDRSHGSTVAKGFGSDKESS